MWGGEGRRRGGETHTGAPRRLDSNVIFMRKGAVVFTLVKSPVESKAVTKSSVMTWNPNSSISYRVWDGVFGTVSRSIFLVVNGSSDNGGYANDRLVLEGLQFLGHNRSLGSNSAPNVQLLGVENIAARIRKHFAGTEHYIG